MRELVVDGFAGGGGASAGITAALGRAPDLAYNHDAVAVAMHRANHPDTKHIVTNIMRVDPLAEVGTRPVGLAWFSPDCKHHSKAKGGRPVKRAIRDLAWVVVLWARRARPRVIILENVEEFRDWGPLIKKDDAWYPCPERRGQTFDRWVGELRRLGYKVEWRELRACDYGAPTIRKRLFLIARRDGLPIVWPSPTHGNPKSDAVKAGELKPWRTAAEIIDWSQPCHSIFLTREQGRAVGVNRPLAEATMARIAKGVKRYVLDSVRPFLVPVTHQGDERVQGVDDPLRTVTTAQRGEEALVTPFLTKFRAGAVGASIEEPAPTVTANSYEKRPGGAAPIGLVAPYLVPRYQEKDGHEPRTRSVEAPAATVMPRGNAPGHLVTPVLVGCGGRAGQSRPRSADDPTHTCTAKADTCLVAGYLVPRYGERPGQEPRTRSLEEPAPVVVPTGNGGSLAAVHLQRQFGQSIGSDADEPVGSIMPGGGGKTALVSAFLAQHNTDMTGHDVREPVSTIVGKGCTQAVVSAGMVSIKGEDRRGRSVYEPAATVLAGGTHAAEVRAFLMKYYGSAIGQDASEPLHSATSKARFGLVTVTIEGEPYVIADIGMRMLTPRELFRAQGFGDAYIIDRGLDEAGDWAPLTKTAQVRMCGNSVCPPLAEALVRANYAEGQVRRPRTLARAPLFEGVAA